MKILFIGNSYTFYNDMPKLLEKLAHANGKDAEVFSVTKGGRKLFQYLDLQDEPTEKFNAATDGSQQYDVVLLQEQSFLPMADFEAFADGVRRIAEKVRPLTQRIVMYQTWGRKDEHPLLAERGWTHESMTEGLAKAYDTAAQEIGAEVSPVGLRFSKIYRSHPEVELYAADFYHPSYVGSCLAALTHYETIFGEKPQDLSPLELSEEVLDIITK